MNKQRKFELVKRTLGIKHKLKVLDSMAVPEAHEELAQLLIARWELEDELNAIESILKEVRNQNVGTIKNRLLTVETYISGPHRKAEAGQILEMQ